MDIKIGEYVRTKSGFIGKVIGRHGGYGLHYELDVNKEIQENFMNSIVHEDNIVKHSKSIIDLIEVGDIVNGRLVLQVDYKKQNVCLLIPLTDTKANTNIMWYGYEDIKTILTHEQMEENQYVVKRNMETN